MKKPKKCVRLMCEECGRDDFDGITERQLEKLRKTWFEIHEVQSWEASITIWSAEEQRSRPISKSNFGWETHMGLCPDCDSELEEDCAKRKREAAERNRLLF